MPTPPATCNAPVMLDIEVVVLVIVKISLYGLILVPVDTANPF